MTVNASNEIVFDALGLTEEQQKKFTCQLRSLSTPD